MALPGRLALAAVVVVRRFEAEAVVLLGGSAVAVPFDVLVARAEEAEVGLAGAVRAAG